MDKNSKIFVAGHQGLVGSAIVRMLGKYGYSNIVTRTHQELDLTNQENVMEFFKLENPEYVFLAAAKVGGILANSMYPADFIRENLMIQNSVIDASYRSEVRKLVFLGSSCIYPRLAPQPIKEEYLLTGPLETTNEWYAIAKIAGIKMVQAYRRQYGFNGICLMPTNLFGPQDNFDLETSHVLPALIHRFTEAKYERQPSVSIWGTGTARREFLYVDDMADATIFLMENYDGEEIVNIGVGQDVSIAELATIVADVVGYKGQIVYDNTKPDGTPRKLLDTSTLASLGWTANTPLREGIHKTYRWFVENIKNVGIVVGNRGLSN